jgi:F0F1-type ATP synthase beta subunit
VGEHPQGTTWLEFQESGVIDARTCRMRAALFYGQMTEPPGARRVTRR